ncbi:MAG: hypothetical protein WEA24_09580 [Gemmatimonadota bacterium]
MLVAISALLAACAGDAPRTAELTFPPRDSGQVNAEPACADCTIAFDTVVTLGADSDPGGISERASVVWAVDSRGRYFVPVGRGEVFIYGPDAAFQRSLAPAGPGPGELPVGRSHVTIGPADTVRVVSQYPHPGRIHVFGPDLAFVRSAALDPGVAGPITTAYHAASDRFVFPETSAAQASVSIVASDGSLAAAFDPHVEATPRRAPHRPVVAPDGTIWTVHGDLWGIDAWSPDGQLQRTFRGAMPWADGERNGLSGMSFDDQGHAFLHGAVRNIVMLPGGAGIDMENSSVHAVVEAMDLASGTLLARTTFEEGISGAPFGPLPWRFVESPSGNIRLQVLRPRLVRN